MRSSYFDPFYKFPKAKGELPTENTIGYSPHIFIDKTLGFSRDDIEYAKMREKKDRELMNNITDSQKRMVADLLSGKIFKLSKLIEEI